MTPRALLPPISRQNSPAVRNYRARACRRWLLPQQQVNNFLNYHPAIVYHPRSRNLSVLSLNVGSKYFPFVRSPAWNALQRVVRYADNLAKGTDVTAENFPHLATFCDIKGKDPEQLQSLIALGVALSLRDLRLEQITCSMQNANHDKARKNKCP